MNQYPSVHLGAVLQKCEEREQIRPERIYKEITVRLWGKGVVLRREVLGAEIVAERRQVARAGDFILSRIDARNGAFGLVPEDLDRAIVSGDFPLFRADDEALDSEFLNWMTKTSWFVDICKAASEGTTNRVRLKEERFLASEIPLPPIEEQRRIVAIIRNLSSQVESACILRKESCKEADALISAELNLLLGDPCSGLDGALGWSAYVKDLDSVVDDVADGPHVTPQYVDSGIPFITVLNMTSGTVNFRSAKFITPEAHSLYQRRARAEMGDVLISKDGTIGVPCVVDTGEEFSFFVSVALIKPKRTLLDGNFLAWVIRAPYLQRRIRERSRGDMIRHLVLREIRALPVLVPPIKLQRELVAHMDARKRQVDALQRLQHESEVELDALIPSILDKAFNGEL